ncbi:peptidase inhibitor family I36 protein [Dactylosporangium roseum]|uniref:Peptidase inhibitor family I36 protein n=1 Tax=Dactylosporangium roseum TaxID=47989 RepID=A0ABY5ZG57_9ACTN|nr:peptidase inhibitor family I36 protein [Dactylosporangium roseum]UWZ39943.1 peptidase inhibitor family I36 protein [Dactylosporangium roseum]
MRINVMAAVVTAVLLVSLSPLPASADPSPVAVEQQRKVAAELAAHPGGVQIGPNQIAYPGGLIVTVTRPGTAAAAPQPDCPSGWFCFYEQRQFGYPRGQLSDLGWQDLATWRWQDRTESVHNNLPCGAVVYLNHPAGTSSHGGDMRLFEASARQSIADLGANRNIADHVYRYC